MIASLIPLLQRPLTKLVGFGVAAVVSVYAGFLGLGVEAAGTVVKLYGYYFLLAAFAGWVAVLYGLWRQCRPERQLGRAELLTAGAAITLLSSMAICAEPFRSKVLYDEFVLQSTAFNMHYFRDTATMVRGYDILGTFLSLDNYLDKRPNFYPFLISLCHDLTGYRVANAYWLNAFLYPVALALGYWLGRRLNGLRGGLLAVLLLGALPLLGQNATGSGMELLNFCMILAVAALGGAYLRQPDELRLSALVLGAVLLAQSRYESAIYVLPVAVIILLGWWREKRIILSWASVLAPVLLLPCALQNKVLNNTKWMWELKEHQESRFSTAYLGKNLENARAFLFSDSQAFANSLIVSWLGVAALGALVWLAVRRRTRPADAGREKTVLGLLGLTALANTALIMFYYWSSFTDPMASRFSLPLYLVLIFAIVTAVAGLGWRWLSPVLTGLACLAVVVAASRYGLNLYSHTGIDEIEWERRLVAARAAGTRLIVTNKSTLPWLLGKTPSILTGRARLVADRMRYQMQTGTFDEILVMQSFRPTTREGDHEMLPDDELPKGFHLEPIAERRFGTKITRVSRLVSIDAPETPASVTAIFP